MLKPERASLRDDLAAVIRQHSECVANSKEGPGSGTTLIDEWSCGIELPFEDDLDDMKDAHLVAALMSVIEAHSP